MSQRPSRVLIVTGGMLIARDSSPLGAIRRNLASLKASSGAWLDLHTKIVAAELLIAAKVHRRGSSYTEQPYHDAVEHYFGGELGVETPELTEVSLATLLAREGVPFEATTYAELYANPSRRQVLLDACDVVFASATLLRDMSELIPMVQMLKRPHNRVVVGGALAGIVHHRWQGCPGLDVLAVGYGEYLVPSLAEWIRSGFELLEPPPGGRKVEVHANYPSLLRRPRGL